MSAEGVAEEPDAKCSQLSRKMDSSKLFFFEGILCEWQLTQHKLTVYSKV